MPASGLLIRLFLFFAMSCGMCPVALAAQTAEEPADAIGIVAYLAGTVTAQRPDGETRQLDLDDPVRTGDEIITAVRSSVEIVFKDNSVFSQGADSRTKLDEYVYSATPSASRMLLKVGVGTARYVTGKIVEQNPDGFALKTSLATIGIRGTGVFAEVSPQGERIGVLAMTPGHTVSVTSPVGTRTIDRAGWSVSVSPDGQVSAPAPTDPETRSRVIRSAPQTTQGERPGAASVSPGEIQNRIDAFDAAMERTKGELGGLGSRPDYGALHTLSLQSESKRSAEGDQDNTGGMIGAGLGSDTTDNQDTQDGGGNPTGAGPTAGP